VVQRWLQWGARFDRTDDDHLKLALEGGHSVPRIVHAGDQTGAEIQRLLLQRSASAPRLSVLENTFVLDLITDGEAVRGAVCWAPRQGFFSVWAGSTILCTGGVGQLYRETSNPVAATGDGLAMAYRAGAVLRGMEFVQFHPTVLYVAGMSRILVSETARGEGRGAARPPRPPLHARVPQGRRAGATRRGLALDRGPAGQGARHARVPRHAPPAGGPRARALPAHPQGLPRVRHRHHARPHPGAPRLPLHGGAAS
jgi:succinate dehydrogenase/fumarate reductase flavoprotein subunit